MLLQLSTKGEQGLFFVPLLLPGGWKDYENSPPPIPHFLLTTRPLKLRGMGKLNLRDPRAPCNAKPKQNCWYGHSQALPQESGKHRRSRGAQHSKDGNVFDSLVQME